MAKLKIETKADQKLVDAAEAVLTMFKRREIKSKEFDMLHFSDNKHDKHGNICGTSHCIGGWMSISLGDDGRDDPRYYYVGKHSSQISPRIHAALGELFYPENNDYKAKPKHAIKAIENFLAGRKKPWRGVMKEND